MTALGAPTRKPKLLKCEIVTVWILGQCEACGETFHEGKFLALYRHEVKPRSMWPTAEFFHPECHPAHSPVRV